MNRTGRSDGSPGAAGATPERRYSLAIVGWPVAHSLSPALWEGLGERRGLVIEYGLYPVPPGDHAAWGAVWASELDGFNVTAPYKDRATRLCDRLAPPAARIGAANTVLRRGDGWEGHTTDGYGFARSLDIAEEPLSGRTVAVLGTGGAGRAVARAAADAGGEVTLVSRSPDASPAGCEDCTVIGWDALAVFGPFEVVVNATPLGGRGSPAPPVPDTAWNRDALAVDLHYSPPVTPFLEAARSAGARTLNGLGMLVHQACLGAALLIDGDGSAAESYEADFWAVARRAAPGTEGDT